MTPVPPEITVLDAFPDKATYLPGQSATINVVLRNGGTMPFAGQLAADLMYLTAKVADVRAPIAVAGGQTLTATVTLRPPADDFRGYGVDVRVLDSAGAPVATASTALDMLSNWALAPRYGFFADFAANEPDTAARAAALSKYHINVVQYYDWMWRHYELLPPSSEDQFVDGMGRRLSLKTVKDKIALAHQHNMAALAYGAVYGAEPEYFTKHQDWALFKADGTPESIERLFYVMNIAPGSPWNDVIVGEYVKAVADLEFDGIHMDQYGFPKVAHVGGKDGPVVDVGKAFGPLIDRSAAAVRQVRPGAQVIFNNVNDWPTELTAARDQAAVYIEVWPPHDSYYDLQRLIVRGKEAAGGKKQVILAAYMTPLCLTKDKPEKIPQAEEGTRLTSAAIYANGGFHLLLGEQNGALCDPYYPKYATLRAEFVPVMRAYYDFTVRYENWLADPRLELLPYEAVGADGRVRLGIENYSSKPRPDLVWAIAREAPGTLTLSLVNMVGLNNYLWNAVHEPPTPQEHIPVTLQVVAPVQSVVLASPDTDGGRAQALDFQAQGNAVTFTVPRLDRWDLVIVTMGEE
jgi:dextranase